MTRLRPLLVLLSVCAISLQSPAQCDYNLNPVLTIDIANNYGFLTWDYPPNQGDCQFLHFEVELGQGGFTPGSGEITPIITPANTLSFWDLSLCDAAVRAVCDCDMDGIGDYYGVWEMAFPVLLVQPDAGASCQGAPSLWETSTCVFEASGIWTNYTCDNCTNEQYAVWRQFNAGETGSIEIDLDLFYVDQWGTLFPESIYMGLAIREECDGSEFVSYTDITPDQTVEVSGLEPGENYVIGIWLQDMFYDFFQLNESYEAHVQIQSVEPVLGTCPPPIDPILVIDGFADEYFVHWQTPTDSNCPILGYEVEYADNSFTPGMGEGTSVTVSAPPVDVSWNAQYAYVRTLCDCEGALPGDDPDGIPDLDSPWVEATLYTPIYPDPAIACGAVESTVHSADNCGDPSASMNFIGVFADFPEFTPSCMDEPQYVLWTTFTAPESGNIQLGMSSDEFGGGELWNDFGISILDQCEGNQVFCEASFGSEDEIIVTGLSPGQDYVTASWNNGYPYFFDGQANYNGTSNLLSICEHIPDVQDLSLIPAEPMYIECGESIPTPVYTLGADWPETTTVDWVFEDLGSCGEASLYVITADDGQGYTASAEQPVYISDTTAPSLVIPPDELYACGETIQGITYTATDNCSDVDVTFEETQEDFCSGGYVIFRTFTATDACGNSSIAEQVIEVVDSVAPVFGTCPDTITINIEEPFFDMTYLGGSPSFQLEDNCSPSIEVIQSIQEGTELEVGSYPISFMAVDDCGNTSLCESTLIISNTVGIDNLEQASFDIYPNPVSQTLMIDFDAAQLSTAGAIIFDISGREVLEASDLDSGIDVYDLKPGSYIIQLVDADGLRIGQRLFKKTD